MAFDSYGPDSTGLPSVQESATESRAFGIRVGRLDYGLGTRWSDVDIAATLDAADCDLVVMRYPAQRLDLLDQLQACGRATITADPLLYLRRDAVAMEHDPVVLRTAGSENRAEIDAAIAEIFDGYVTHYMANPVTRDVDIVHAYQEWIGLGLLGPGAHVALADVAGLGSVGMGMVQRRDDVTEIQLIGIRPPHRSRGLYQATIRALTDEAFTTGAVSLVTSVQASNTGSLRGFAAVGYYPYLTLSTVHVMRAEREDLGR